MTLTIGLFLAILLLALVLFVTERIRMDLVNSSVFTAPGRPPLRKISTTNMGMPGQKALEGEGRSARQT